MSNLIISKPAGLKQVKLSDAFWSGYAELVRNTMLLYQWDILNDRVPDAEPSHAIRNFRIASGEENGEFKGERFQDTDVAKWLEAVSYSLETNPDPELESIADSVIDIIKRAQQPDGYLDTFYIIKEPAERWRDLHEGHELYVVGHLTEAAAAYYKATGKRKLLEVACRFADYIDTVFGPEPYKMRGYPGHPEIELALVKLYNVTGNEKYLKLSKFFIDERGKEPCYFVKEWMCRGGYSSWSKVPVPFPDLKYNLAHKPVREQDKAVGHAVRAVYLYSAMADIARETGDKQLFDKCMHLWRNIVRKQMYITGGIGSTHHGESFTFDYDLPNDTVYAETCASIGLIFFAHRMLQMDIDSEYGDVIERALYNIVLGSMSRDGKRFFYVNPLEVWPEACENNPDRKHVRPVRQKWFGCACCPPNAARLLTSLNQYIYSFSDNTVYTHLYIGGEVEAEIGNGNLRMAQKNFFPWDGRVKISIVSSSAGILSLAFRIPGWCRNFTASINGTKQENIQIEKGYALFRRNWKAGDEIKLIMDMPVETVYSNPQVRANAGKVSLQRGPLVYCLEEADNGKNLSAISIDLNSPFTVEADEKLMTNAIVIKGKAARITDDDWEDTLYRTCKPGEKDINFKAVPYFMWGNRGQGEMLVWIRKKE
jgi:DUF1680 family protein